MYNKHLANIFYIAILYIAIVYTIYINVQQHVILIYSKYVILYVFAVYVFTVIMFEASFSCLYRVGKMRPGRESLY